MEYRPFGWKNPFTISILREKPNLEGTNTSTAGYTKKKIPDPVFEAGASAMGEHILSLLKEKARSSVIIDILECRK